MGAFVEKLFLYSQLVWHYVVYCCFGLEQERHHANLGTTYFRLGNFQKAIKKFEKSEQVRNSADTGFARYNSYYLGYSYLNLKEFRKALAHFQKYLFFKPSDGEVREIARWCEAQIKESGIENKITVAEETRSVRNRYIIVGLAIVAVVLFLGRERLSTRPLSVSPDGKVYFVPLGDFTSPSLVKLVRYYKQKYGLSIEPLAAIKLETLAADFERRQLIAEELIALMKRHYSQLANDPNVILIGITPGDIYIRQYAWQFAFGWRQEGRFAVVSSCRMDPVRFGQSPDDELLQMRLRKMITRNIGIMHYGLKQNNSPTSVLYHSILGLDDLDRRGEDF